MLRLCRHVEADLVKEPVDECRCSFGWFKFWSMWCKVQESWIFDAEDEEEGSYV